MSFDPFQTSRDHLERDLSELEQLAHDYTSLTNRETSSAQWNKSNIVNKLDAATQHKGLLDEACNRAASDPSRFDITPEELNARQLFLERVTQRLKIVGELVSEEPLRQPTRAGMSRDDRIRALGIADNQQFIDGEMHHQQMMLEQQDEMLDTMGEKTGKLHGLSKQINTELADDEVRRGDIEQHMDNTQTKLDKLVQKVKEGAKKKSTWMWLGCGVLTLLVVIMIIWAFFV